MCKRARLVLTLLPWLLATTAHGEEWIPVELRGGLLTFPAVVEGVATRAALNTSAPLSSIDAAFAQQLGLTLSGKRKSISSASSASRIVASEAQLDVEFLGQKAAVRDAPALQHPDTPLQLGASVLEPFVLEIDYPNSRIRISPRSSLDLRKQDNVPMRAAEGSCQRNRTASNTGDLGVGVNDFTRAGLPQGDAGPSAPCLPTVQVKFPGGRKVWLLLDTGAAGPLVVSRAVAKREGWLDSYRKGGLESADVFGTRTRVDMLLLPSVSLGPYELGDIPVAVPAEGERALSGQESWGRVQTGSHVTRGARANGRIGYDALRHFVVTIDLQRELLRITRPAKESAAATQ